MKRFAHPVFAGLCLLLLFPPWSSTHAEAPLAVGSLFTCGLERAVYFLDADQRRHAFPNEATYFSWFADFSNNISIPMDQCAQYPLGKNVTAKPGSLLIKLPTVPDVFAVAAPNVLRHITSETTTMQLFGATWNQRGANGLLRDIPDVFFSNYTVGAPILSLADYDPKEEQRQYLTLADCFAIQERSEAANSAFITDPLKRLVPTALQRPAFGTSVYDPTYQVFIKRISEDAAAPQLHAAATLQPFNADATLILLEEDGVFLVRDLATLETLRTLRKNIVAPRWNPAKKDELYYFDDNYTNDYRRIKLYRLQVSTGVETEVVVFPQPYGRVDGDVSFSSLSRDGRWMAIYAGYTNEEKWGFLAYDLSNAAFGAMFDFDVSIKKSCSPGAAPRSVAVSPLGNYLVVTWDTDTTLSRFHADRCTGVEAYDIKTGAYLGHVANQPFAGDMGIDARGNEVYVAASAETETVVTSTVFPGSPDFSKGYGHAILNLGSAQVDTVSCQDGAGVCLVSTLQTSQQAPLDQELLQITVPSPVAGVSATSRMLRYVNHRSSGCTAQSKPKAVYSPAGRFVLFASDWGSCLTTPSTFLVDLE